MIRIRPIVASAVVAAALAFPTVGGTQGQQFSNASLQDTLSWLRNFLPAATGAPNYYNMAMTESLDPGNGCQITLRIDTLYVANNSHVHSYESFSLSDIDPATVSASFFGGTGVNLVGYWTRGRASLIVDGNDTGLRLSGAGGTIGYFTDPASAQRVANALQHAAQLCARP